MPSRLRRDRSQITLARAISKFGVASRTQAARIVQEGRVKVNEKVARSPDLWVDPGKDGIVIDGKALQRKKFEYLVMNKPIGVVTTRMDELGRKTVYALLPADSWWLFPVGRLDKETSGLLLFTNDTRFGDKITNPVTKLPKTYRVSVDRGLQLEDKRKMESRFLLDERTELKPARVSVSSIDPRQFEITIIEGKNRQIRRLCERLGYRVLSLCRISIGAIRLGELGEGRTRVLSERERASILSSVKT